MHIHISTYMYMYVYFLYVHIDIRTYMYMYIFRGHTTSYCDRKVDKCDSNFYMYNNIHVHIYTQTFIYRPTKYIYICRARHELLLPIDTYI